MHPDAKLVGTARTLRFVPGREDLFARHGGGYNAQKRAFDTVGEGEVIVIEARGETGSGTLGDILALRAHARGAAGIVTDGGVRDHAAVAAVGIPVYSAGAHPAVLGRLHVPWDVDVAVACGGTTVEPGDVVVGDGDGVVVIPPALVEEVVDAALAQEEEDGWIARAGRRRPPDRRPLPDGRAVESEVRRMAREPVSEAATRSKSQHAYHSLKERIAAEELTPGHRLVLASVANELGMSVVPVREAIRRLEAEGLVTFERNVGARVSMIDDSQYRHSMETLAILEGAATALAARHLTADDVRQARELNRRLVESLDDFDPRLLHLAEPRVPLGALRRLPEPAPARARRVGVGPAGPPARLDVQLRARPRAGVGARARDPPRPHRDRRTPGGHRAGRPRAPLGHPRRLPQPRAPRRGDPCPVDLPDRLQHYIGGEHVDSADGATFDGPRPGVERDVPARRGRQGGGRRPGRRRGAARVRRRDRGRGCCRASARGSCTASPTSSSRATPGSPSSRASTPGCRSPRRSARRAGPPRTSGSSPTWWSPRPTTPSRCPAGSSTTSTASRSASPG